MIPFSGSIVNDKHVNVFVVIVGLWNVIHIIYMTHEQAMRDYRPAV